MQYCKLVIQEVHTVCRKLLYFALTDDEHILKLLIFPHFKILKIFCEVFFTSMVFRCRISWLQRGSREIFGTIVEEAIYLLIDTSLSMQPHIEFVKEKIFLLFQVRCSLQTLTSTILLSGARVRFSKVPKVFSSFS